jgi:hypothetical protein
VFSGVLIPYHPRLAMHMFSGAILAVNVSALNIFHQSDPSCRANFIKSTILLVTQTKQIAANPQLRGVVAAVVYDNILASVMHLPLPDLTDEMI